MSKKHILIFLLVLLIFVFQNNNSIALQSGGVEIGDLETGSVTGVPFKALDVDFTLTALCVGGQKAWYPPLIVLDLRTEGTGGRAGRPIVMRVINELPIPQGLALSADSAFAGPTSLNVKMVIKNEEIKYIGLPISDLTYVTTGSRLTFSNFADPNMLDSQLLIIR
ncbi:MAG: hypothetical protein KC592_12970 [Nitrospira sp.]|nr:hypothetical protein [Nitrospira sp.]